MATRRLLSLSLAFLAGLACIQDDGKRFNPLRDMTSVSEDEEREMGFHFDVEAQKHLEVIEDPIVAAYISDLGQEIVRTIEPQPFLYRFRIVNDPALNAFAVPGGYIYFHSGTVLAATNVDELAGVMGHEIAHVKGHHYARMVKKQQIPNILAKAAGLAAAIAAQQPGIFVAAEAANVALQLKFSREFENEADQLGTVFMSRAGFDPGGITRFFEKLIDQKKRTPASIPPYLFSHPDVEDRIESVRIQADSLRATRAPDPRFEAELRDVQRRLSMLLKARRNSLPPPSAPLHPERVDPLLTRADDLAQEGRLDEALLVLGRAEAQAPSDPRVPFRVGELLAASGRHAEALKAYRRTIRHDPTRALVFYRMGVSHRALGNRVSAVQAFEQASRRAGAMSDLRKKADWQIETQIFPVFIEVGFADGAESGDADTPLGLRREAFAIGARRLGWWARLSSHHAGMQEIRVRWRNPRGILVAETEAHRSGRTLSTLLELEEPGVATAGLWTAEATYEGDIVDQKSFEVLGDQDSR